MKNFELLKFSHAEQLARGAAAAWLEDLGQLNSSTARYCVALSGGRIAAQFLLAVADQVGRSRLPLDFIHFFWGDERCVPPTDSESNFSLAQRHLLLPLGISEGQIHRIRGESPPEIAAAGAEADLRQTAPSNSEGCPVLDLVLLGMGAEGHVASLFPGESNETMHSSALFRPVHAPKLPSSRITLGYHVIAAARQAWVLASGEEKRDALLESLNPEGITPLGRVLRLREHTRILTDFL